MYRSHTCGELRMAQVGSIVTLSGWVQKVRDKGFILWVDLRDRYGITQLIFSEERSTTELLATARTLGREFVIQVQGKVIERSSKNDHIITGDIEIEVTELTILNASKTPPFTIEEKTDGGDEIRMQYRYLDLRRDVVQNNIIFRSRLGIETRKYLADQGFIEIETPFLIKSTPEGARDFVVPSRMNQGQFYALPQSPQTFKQLLMVSGFDKYFQIVKCFRDEDLRADRQPEFTQIDCEMSYVHRDDILNTFENLTNHIFKSLLNKDLGEFPRMRYDDAMEQYGSDKPDLRFGMPFNYFTTEAQNKGFSIFDQAENVIGICAPDAADKYSNKDLKKLTEWMQRPQIGAKGLVHVRWMADDSIKSTVGKFYEDDTLKQWMVKAGGGQGDMLLILSGETEKTRKQLNELRLKMGYDLKLIDPKDFKPLWVVDFPLLEWDEDAERFHAMHHPFTAPKEEDVDLMLTGDHATLKSLRADAYDLVINGSEIGGGSIRIHDRALQERNFDLLGFSKEEAEAQFGFLMGAFEYGAPPHGGIAFGFDRLCAVLSGQSSIRDFIAFPKNNMGRDIMIDAPASIDSVQLKELNIQVDIN